MLVIAHRRRHALDGVGDAEDFVQARAVLGVGLDADDRGVQRLEILARLGEEELDVLGVTEAFTTPTRSSESLSVVVGSPSEIFRLDQACLRNTNGRTRSSPSPAGLTIISVEPSTKYAARRQRVGEDRVHLLATFTLEVDRDVAKEDQVHASVFDANRFSTLKVISWRSSGFAVQPPLPRSKYFSSRCGGASRASSSV